eukprot:gene12107-5599_t
MSKSDGSAQDLYIVERSNGQKEARRKSLKMEGVQKLDFDLRSRSTSPKGKSKSLRKQNSLHKKTKTVLHPYQLVIDGLYQKQKEKLIYIEQQKFKHDFMRDLLGQGNSLLLFFLSTENPTFNSVMLNDFNFYYRKLMFLNVNPILITPQSQEEFEVDYEQKKNSFHIIYDNAKNFFNIFQIKTSKIHVAVLVDKEGVKNHIVVESGAARINFMSFFLHTDETGKKINEFYLNELKYSKKRRSKAILPTDMIPFGDDEFFRGEKNLRAFVGEKAVKEEVTKQIVKEVIEQNESPESSPKPLKKGILNLKKSFDEVLEVEDEEEEIPIITKRDDSEDLKMEGQNPLWKFASNEKLTLLDEVDESLFKMTSKDVQNMNNSDMKNISFHVKTKQKFKTILQRGKTEFFGKPKETKVENPHSELELKEMEEYANMIKQLKENFTYEDIYSSEKYFSNFKIFLSTEFALENALFFEHVEEYKSKSKKERKDFVEEIKKKFFGQDSNYEINISNKEKKHVISKIQKGDLKDNLFHSITKELKYGLMFDSYTRYIKTEAFVVMLVQGP